MALGEKWCTVKVVASSDVIAHTARSLGAVKWDIRIQFSIVQLVPLLKRAKLCPVDQWHWFVGKGLSFLLANVAKRLQKTCFLASWLRLKTVFNRAPFFSYAASKRPWSEGTTRCFHSISADDDYDENGSTMNASSARRTQTIVITRLLFHYSNQRRWWDACSSREMREWSQFEELFCHTFTSHLGKLFPRRKPFILTVYRCQSQWH